MDRALRMQRTMFAGLQRRAVYAGLGNIPTGVSERVSSMVDEYMARTMLGSVKSINARFHTDRNSGPRAYLEHIVKDTLEHSNNLYTEKDADGNHIGFVPKFPSFDGAPG